MKIIAFSNCPLDPVLGSGRTRLAWSEGLRGLGHQVQIVDTRELLAGVAENASGRRLRLGWNTWRWLETHPLDDIDLIEFYGAEFWLATWRLAARKPGSRPFLAAHTDGLELLAADRLEAAALTARAAATVQPGAAASTNVVRATAAAILRRGEGLAFSRCDGFVTGCELDRRYLADRRVGDPDRLAVIPLGLEPPYLDLPAPGVREERVALLGSWIERKGIAHIVATMTSLLKARPNLRLDVFGAHGSDPNSDFPADVHPQIDVHPRMTIPELVAGLSRARIFFFPSEYEGFGLGLAEAMACGCAPVTTPTGFGAELKDGEEALLCDFGDVPAMRRAVSHLLDDAADCARVAQAAWQRVQVLRWESSVRRLEQTYLQWIAAPAARH